MPPYWMHVFDPPFLAAADGRGWVWASAEQTTKGFAKGWFERLQFGFEFYTPTMADSPYPFFNVRWHLARIFLGARRASALELIFRFHAEQDIWQRLKNALAGAGVFAKHEFWHDGWFLADVLVLRRLPAAPNTARLRMIAW